MTAPESSLSRWSRLKREAVSKGQADAGQDDIVVGSAGPENTEPETGLGEGLVDPEELPSIDTITIDTDIRAFLKSRVPAELTRAALRRAWISDPAIRDFVGIAENQWDFNDPTGEAKRACKTESQANENFLNSPEFRAVEAAALPRVMDAARCFQNYTGVKPGTMIGDDGKRPSEAVLAAGRAACFRPNGLPK